MAPSSKSSKRTISLGKVLVVGGCGILGSHFVEQLLNFPNEDLAAVSKEQAEKGTQLLKTRTSGPVPHSSTFTYPSAKSRYPTYTDTDVHVLDLKCVKNRYPGATYHEGDITSAESLVKVFKKVRPDVIFHTASPDPHGSVALLRKVNVDGTRTLLEVAGGEAGDWGGVCKAFVYTSSSSAIHDAQTDLLNADEKYPLIMTNTKEPYSSTKAEADQLVLDQNGKYKGMLTCSLRPAGIMGERDLQYSCGVLQHALVAPPGQLRVQLGDNENLFDLTYAGNIAYAHFLAAERLLETHRRVVDGNIAPLPHEKVDGEAFMITNDSPATFWDSSFFLYSLVGKVIEPSQVISLPEWLAWPLGTLAETFNSMLGRPSRFNATTVRYACMRRYFSCDKAKSRLGYSAVIGLEEALIRSTKSFLERVESKEIILTKQRQ